MTDVKTPTRKEFGYGTSSKWPEYANTETTQLIQHLHFRSYFKRHLASYCKRLQTSTFTAKTLQHLQAPPESLTYGIQMSRMAVKGIESTHPPAATTKGAPWRGRWLVQCCKGSFCIFSFPTFNWKPIQTTRKPGHSVQLSQQFKLSLWNTSKLHFQWLAYILDARIALCAILLEPPGQN